MLWYNKRKTIDVEELKHMILEEYDRNPPETAYTNCMAVFTRVWVKGTISSDNYKDLHFMNEERYDEVSWKYACEQADKM